MGSGRLSPIVDLCPDSETSQPRDTVGRAAAGFDQPPLLQPAEDRQGAIGQDIAVTGKAFDKAHLAPSIALVADDTALRQHVQHALLVS